MTFSELPIYSHLTAAPDAAAAASERAPFQEPLPKAENFVFYLFGSLDAIMLGSCTTTSGGNTMITGDADGEEIVAHGGKSLKNVSVENLKEKSQQDQQDQRQRCYATEMLPTKPAFIHDDVGGSDEPKEAVAEVVAVPPKSSPFTWLYPHDHSDEEGRELVGQEKRPQPSRRAPNTGQAQSDMVRPGYQLKRSYATEMFRRPVLIPDDSEEEGQDDARATEHGNKRTERTVRTSPSGTAGRPELCQSWDTDLALVEEEEDSPSSSAHEGKKGGLLTEMFSKITGNIRPLPSSSKKLPHGGIVKRAGTEEVKKSPRKPSFFSRSLSNATTTATEEESPKEAIELRRIWVEELVEPAKEAAAATTPATPRKKPSEFPFPPPRKRSNSGRRKYYKYQLYKPLLPRGLSLALLLSPQVPGGPLCVADVVLPDEISQTLPLPQGSKVREAIEEARRTNMRNGWRKEKRGSLLRNELVLDHDDDVMDSINNCLDTPDDDEDMGF